MIVRVAELTYQVIMFLLSLLLKWRGCALTSVHGIYSDTDVVFTRKQLLQSSKVEDVPQQVSVGVHRVHNLHCGDTVLTFIFHIRDA